MSENPQQLASQKPGQHLTLSDIALSLNATLDLNTLLKYAVNAASVLVDTEGAFILLPDESHKILSLREQYSLLDNNLLPPFEIEVKGSVAGRVLKSGEHILAEDETALEITSGKRAVTLLYIPMISRKQIVGVLAVYNLSYPTTFSRYELKILRQLASHAAVAIENARIHEEIQARSFELALIIDATEAVNSTLSLPHVLSLIGKNLLKALQCNWGEVVTNDISFTEIHTLSAQRTTFWQKNNPVLSLASVPKLAKAIRQQKQLTLDARSVSENERELLQGGRQMLIVPFDEENQFCGILKLVYLQDSPEPTFWESLPKMAGEIARQYEAGKPLRATHLMRQVLRASTADGCSLWLCDDKKSSLQLILDESNFVWTTPPYLTRSLENFPTLSAALTRQRMSSYTLTDRDLPDDVEQLMRKDHLEVLLIVPFIIQADNRGLVLLADTMRNHRFERREMNLAKALVLQAANALKNARLFEDLQSSLEELRQAQAKLVQSARLRAIGELAAAVAHQINNPLTTILGDTQLILSDVQHDNPQRKSLEAIYRAGQRALEVVQRLLSVARQKPSDEPPRLMNINATILNTLALVKGTLSNNRIQLDINLDDELPFAYGIAGQVEDVWLNLILNARDALRNVDKPTISICSRYSPALNSIEVQISDNGRGLGEVDPEQLFRAFYTTKQPDEGTGLGLYICASVVARCGGTISAGESPSGGALFTISLPCDSPNKGIGSKTDADRGNSVN